MDVILPKCNCCAAVNVAGATGWIRIWGVSIGAQRQPIQPQRWIDFCPDCAAKTTVADLPTTILSAVISPKP